MNESALNQKTNEKQSNVTRKNKNKLRNEMVIITAEKKHALMPHSQFIFRHIRNNAIVLFAPSNSIRRFDTKNKKKQTPR